MLCIPCGPGRMRAKAKGEEVGRRRRRPGRNTKWFAAEGSLVGPEAAGVGLGPTPGRVGAIKVVEVEILRGRGGFEVTRKAGAVIIKLWVVARYTVSPWGRTVALRTLRPPCASLTQDRKAPLWTSTKEREQRFG